VLLFVFGSLLSALLPLLSTGLSLFAALSVVGALSNAFTMASFTSQLCLLIGLGVGIDYSLFILTRARAGLRRCLSVEDAVAPAGDLHPAEASARWARWAELVQTNRLGLGVAALAVMVALAVPAFSLRLGTADYGTDPTTTTTTTHRAYELLVSGFGPGFSGPLELVAPVRSAGQRAAFADVV